MFPLTEHSATLFLAAAPTEVGKPSLASMATARPCRASTLHDTTSFYHHRAPLHAGTPLDIALPSTLDSMRLSLPLGGSDPILRLGRPPIGIAKVHTSRSSLVFVACMFPHALHRGRGKERRYDELQPQVQQTGGGMRREGGGRGTGRSRQVHVRHRLMGWMGPSTGQPIAEGPFQSPPPPISRPT
jgi:hypothetical protein